MSIIRARHPVTISLICAIKAFEAFDTFEGIGEISSKGCPGTHLRLLRIWRCGASLLSLGTPHRALPLGLVMLMRYGCTLYGTYGAGGSIRIYSPRPWGAGRRPGCGTWQWHWQGTQGRHHKVARRGFVPGAGPGRWGLHNPSYWGTGGRRARPSPDNISPNILQP